MRSPRVVERQIPTQAFARDPDAVMGAQIDLFVFDCPPEPFDKDIVPPRAFSIHADLDFGILQRLDEVYGCELAALVRVHDLRLAVAASAAGSPSAMSRLSSCTATASLRCRVLAIFLSFHSGTSKLAQAVLKSFYAQALAVVWTSQSRSMQPIQAHQFEHPCGTQSTYQLVFGTQMRRPC